MDLILCRIIIKGLKIFIRLCYWYRTKFRNTITQREGGSLQSGREGEILLGESEGVRELCLKLLKEVVPF